MSLLLTRILNVHPTAASERLMQAALESDCDLSGMSNIAIASKSFVRLVSITLRCTSRRISVKYPD
ncbi:MAG: hypothetical protein FJ390_04360 [Verrucomicrobia bacterium]|nr:hypothetical protein [Verrucomicrobiota bacterium]